jgi:ABC-type polysaccharide/polyol phosphate export permease
MPPHESLSTSTAPSVHPPLPELVIEGRPRPQLLHSLRELLLFRDTILAYAERDFRIKYKQAVLGIGWAVIQPLAFMAVFSIAFGRFAKVSGGGVSYQAFALSALVPWTFLSTSVSMGTGALVRDSLLFRKVFFPREIVVVGTVLSATADFAFALILFFIVGPLLGAQVSATWLLAPLLALPVIVLATGISSAFGALNVYYRDFRYIVPFAIQLWLFASPVAYPLSAVPDRWYNFVVVFNPAAGLLDSFSRVLARGELPDPQLLGISLAGTLVATWLGYRIFKGLEPSFADVA